ncbi:hypothetical protein BDP27DRAFT_1242705 [Rhodocollybia butyracea]|uniref:Uncharacterized protein n=1 Tax=Rhodocollybia butyracea TaxID=206335 RepID=A0A9P5TY10_9AGAR|nr:hypothetical protein BDP27DRAFT_1242705 [Rhodocollybia butyracea]
MPSQYLTHAQLLHVARTGRQQNCRLLARIQSLEQILGISPRRLKQYKCIITLLSENDVPGLCRLLATNLCRGASPRFVYQQLEKCLKKMYAPCGNFSHCEYDIAFIAKSLCGPRLLFALQKAYGLPSRTTLWRNAHVPELRPCIASPTEKEIEYNLSALFDQSIWKVPPLDSLKHAGKVFMMDGVAVEEVCRYCPACDVVCGLCHEHGDSVDCGVADYNAIKAIKTALDVGKVHVGKDATVLALGSLSNPDDYIPIPVLLSSSCKAEDTDQLAYWLDLFLKVWRSHPNGENYMGQLPYWPVMENLLFVLLISKLQ